MHSCDLSVSELAGITGLGINETWAYAAAGAGKNRTTVWCAPELDAEALLHVAPSSLPPASAIRLQARSGSAGWDAEWPLALDLHWLREITPGFPLGVRPVRVHTAQAVRAAVRVQGDFLSLVWRSAAGDTRAQVALNVKRRVPSIVLEATEQTAREKPVVLDELLRALTGTTSVEWLRGVFADSCSLRWKELARQISARPDQLDDLRVFFRALTTSEEDALWRASASAVSLQELKPCAEALIDGRPSAFEDLLRDELHRVGPAFWRTTLGEWLNGVAGGRLGRLTSTEIALRLAGSARKLCSLLIRDDLAKMLVRLHAAADSEWASLGSWYRSRLAESCGKLRVNPAPGQVIDEVNLWLKKLQTRLLQRSWEAAHVAVQEALATATATADSRGGERLLLADLCCASTPKNNETLERILSGDLRPCLVASVPGCSGVRPLIGLLNSIEGRRIGIQVLLPLLPKSDWAVAREDLARTEIQHTGSGQLTVTGSCLAAAECLAQESAEMLLGAVFTSRAEAPADDMLRMSHEAHRTLVGNEADVTWLRLVRAYGLAIPEEQTMPCEATLRADLPWNWAEAWSDAPAKRASGELGRSIQLSVAMQEMARHWLPALHLSTPEQFDAPGTVLPLLVYAASQPQVSKRKAEFGYDPLSPRRVEQAAASARGKLPELLEQIYKCLLASGRSQIAECYSPERAELIISAVQRRPRTLTALLAGDLFLWEHCLQITTVCREFRALASRNPARALRKLKQAAEEIVKASRRGLSRHYPAQTCRGLGAVYLLEATRVLAGCTGGAFRASLSIEHRATAQGLEAAA